MWTPSNSDKARNGEMVSLAWGLATSNNWISAKLMQLLKPEPVVALAHEMGLYSHIDPVPSICLGVADLTLHEMVGAYSTFPNKGIHTDPIFVTKIEDKYGNVLATFSPVQNEAISEEVAYQMVGLLQNVVNMVDREAKAYGTAIFPFAIVWGLSEINGPHTMYNVPYFRTQARIRSSKIRQSPSFRLCVCGQMFER